MLGRLTQDTIDMFKRATRNLTQDTLDLVRWMRPRRGHDMVEVLYRGRPLRAYYDAPKWSVVRRVGGRAPGAVSRSEVAAAPLCQSCVHRTLTEGVRAGSEPPSAPVVVGVRANKRR